MSDAFAEVGLAPEDGCSPSPAQPGKETQQFMGRVSFELRDEPERLGNLLRNDEDMHMVGHGLHLSDTDTEGTAFGADEAFEVCFNFSINQFFFYISCTISDDSRYCTRSVLNDCILAS